MRYLVRRLSGLRDSGHRGGQFVENKLATRLRAEVALI
jgi:hypothetical protein